MHMPLVGFRSRKAAQVAATFACRSPRLHIEKMKLIKLMYLCERESIDRRGRPIFYDEYYSMKDGPVCSSALNAINGKFDLKTWSAFLRKSGAKDIHATRTFAPDDMDEISKSDQQIIDAIWKKFAHMTSSQLRRWTHDNCHEYTHVENGRLPIRPEDISTALGHSDSTELNSAIKEHRSLELAFPASE